MHPRLLMLVVMLGACGGTDGEVPAANGGTGGSSAAAASGKGGGTSTGGKSGDAAGGRAARAMTRIRVPSPRSCRKRPASHRRLGRCPMPMHPSRRSSAALWPWTDSTCRACAASSAGARKDHGTSRPVCGWAVRRPKSQSMCLSMIEPFLRKVAFSSLTRRLDRPTSHRPKPVRVCLRSSSSHRATRGERSSVLARARATRPSAAPPSSISRSRTALLAALLSSHHAD